MNYKEAIQRAQSTFVGETAEELLRLLNLTHHCASARFGEDIPASWTYGLPREVDGAYEVRLWQQSGGSGVRAIVVSGRFCSEGVKVTIRRDHQAWVDREFSLTTDQTSIADWVCDRYDEVLCARFGAQSLHENQRYYG